MTKEEAILNNEKLVYYCANYFKNYPYKEDLYQSGFMGISKAYENYNPDSECKFSTYAYNYIYGEMCKTVREDKGIKVSRQISKLNLKIEKAYILLAQKNMKAPSTKELANFLNIDEYLIIEALNSNNKINSINEVITEEGDFTLEEVIGYSENIDDKIILKDMLLNLSKEDRDLIVNRYMMDLTQTETSKLMNMSQVQVSRRERKILKKLRDEIAV